MRRKAEGTNLRLNAPVAAREALFSNDQIEATRGLTVTVWYSIAGVPEVRTGISQGVEEAYGQSLSSGKFRKPALDVLVLRDPHRSVKPTANRVEKVGPWTPPIGKFHDVPEGHQVVKDEAKVAWLYKKIYDSEAPVPVEYRIPLVRITKIEETGLVGGPIEEGLVAA